MILKELPDNQKKVTVSEFSKEMRVSVPTTLKWIREGIVPALKIGRVIRIDKDEALAALRSYQPSTRVEEEPAHAA